VTVSVGTLVGGTNYVAWSSNGVVAVTAVFAGNLSTNGLPSDWSFTGGDSSNQVVRTVSNSVVGTTTFIATAGTSSRTNVVVVYGVNAVTWLNRYVSQLEPAPVSPPVGGQRLFPDRPTPGDTTDYTLVHVSAQVTPAVSNAVVWFRAFDVDDASPGATNAPLDRTDTPLYAAGGDNRGSNDWRFVASGTDLVSTNTDASGWATAVLRVSRQPGDNFRVAASCDAATLAALQVTNSTQAAYVTPTNSVPGFGAVEGALTDLLTVWRRLHIEVDSMGPVVSNNEARVMNDFVGTGTSSTQIMVTATLADGSPDLDGSAGTVGNGRFETGTVTLGNGPGATNILTSITGNGTNRVTFTARSLVPVWFSARDSDIWPFTQWISGNVTQIVRDGSSYVYTLDVMNINNGTTVDWFDYVGSWISVGGGAQVPITLVGDLGASNGTFRTASLNVPVNLVDDDVLTGDVPDPDTSGISPIWAAAFIEPRFDTGYNTTNAAFQLNTTDDVNGAPVFPTPNVGSIYTQLTNSGGSTNSIPEYWVVLVKNGYQTGSAPLNGIWFPYDNDPNREDTWRGIGIPWWEGALLFEESIRDWIATPVVDGGGGGVDPDSAGDSGRQMRRQEILNHELGHVFSLWHHDGEPGLAGRANGDVMKTSPRVHSKL
jgi:hypothetical protein